MEIIHNQCRFICYISINLYTIVNVLVLYMWVFFTFHSAYLNAYVCRYTRARILLNYPL